MVGDVGFIRVCWALNPRYSVPSREVLKDRIQRMYGDIIVALQGKLSGIPCGCDNGRGFYEEDG